MLPGRGDHLASSQLALSRGSRAVPGVPRTPTSGPGRACAPGRRSPPVPPGKVFPAQCGQHERGGAATAHQGEVDVYGRGVGHPHHAATPPPATTGWAGSALRPPGRATRPGAGRRSRRRRSPGRTPARSRRTRHGDHEPDPVRRGQPELAATTPPSSAPHAVAAGRDEQRRLPDPATQLGRGQPLPQRVGNDPPQAPCTPNANERETDHARRWSRRPARGAAPPRPAARPAPSRSG